MTAGVEWPSEMDGLATVRRLWRHAEWADVLLLRALQQAPGAEAAWREYAHILGAESVWLARLGGRPSEVPVWPELAPSDVASLQTEIVRGYGEYLDRLTTEGLGRVVPYVNSAGHGFASTAGDILIHVALHGQYHRGKVNQLLREGGQAPAPVDYIAFVRGAAAAVQLSR